MDWGQHIEKEIMTLMQRYNAFDTHSWTSLLRFGRNLARHARQNLKARSFAQQLDSETRLQLQHIEDVGLWK